MLIYEAQKTQPSYEQHKVSFHEVDNVTTVDLAPDINDWKISDHLDEANIDDGDPGNLRGDEDQPILALVTHCKVLSPSAIQQILAIQQFQKPQELMHNGAGEAKKTVTIDDAIYTGSVHNIFYSISKHQADIQETSLVYGGDNESMASVDAMVT